MKVKARIKPPLWLIKAIEKYIGEYREDSIMSIMWFIQEYINNTKKR